MRKTGDLLCTMKAKVQEVKKIMLESREGRKKIILEKIMEM